VSVVDDIVRSSLLVGSRGYIVVVVVVGVGSRRG